MGAIWIPVPKIAADGVLTGADETSRSAGRANTQLEQKQIGMRVRRTACLEPMVALRTAGKMAEVWKFGKKKKLNKRNVVLYFPPAHTLTPIILFDMFLDLFRQQAVVYK